MNHGRRIHDGIAGGLITLGVALGFYVDPLCLLLPGILGVTLLQSRFAGFCPVYFVLDRAPRSNRIPWGIPERFLGIKSDSLNRYPLILYRYLSAQYQLGQPSACLNMVGDGRDDNSTFSIR